jgi:hypothetical protein
MNNTAGRVLGVAAIIVIGLGLLGGGIYFGRMPGFRGFG